MNYVFNSYKLVEIKVIEMLSLSRCAQKSVFKKIHC